MNKSVEKWVAVPDDDANGYWHVIIEGTSTSVAMYLTETDAKTVASTREINVELLTTLKRFERLYDSIAGNKATFANQGQGWNGFPMLANFQELEKYVRTAIVKATAEGITS